MFRNIALLVIFLIAIDTIVVVDSRDPEPFKANVQMTKPTGDGVITEGDPLTITCEGLFTFFVYFY